ncbi:hypothetical protein CPC08DRAFT_718794 [Agrocybe pediades]|nr:hypothetical protein CPC08DRAFT_718794 [Agrocybe pediades]
MPEELIRSMGKSNFAVSSSGYPRGKRALRGFKLRFAGPSTQEMLRIGHLTILARRAGYRPRQGCASLPVTPTMISGNQVLVTGGDFRQINYHGHKDAIAPNAFHDSAARFDPPKCHPHTRVKILDEIMGRIIGQAKDIPVRSFLWLNGAAGAGKSAIAQSIIERCIERGFMDLCVATLAYQLHQAFPGTEVQTEIISAISKEPLIFTKQIQQQFTALVVQPLKTYLSRQKLAEPQTSFLIVIDGLDECKERASQKAILSGLAHSVCDSNPYIRIFVASRPEYDITETFDSKFLKTIHTRLSLDIDRESDGESDIKLYLSDQFEQIKDDCNSSSVFWPKLDQSWPGEGVIQRLAWKSSGQFIYAATVIRYVTSARPKRPDRSLDMVLELRPHDGDHPFAELDALYEKILESCKHIEKVLEVLSLKMIMYTIDNFGVSIFEYVLSYEAGEVGRLFCDLGALVKVGTPGWSTNPHYTHLIILHASFKDYLLDKARSQKFHIDLCDKYISRQIANVLNYLAASRNLDHQLHGGLRQWEVDKFAAGFFRDIPTQLRSYSILPELLEAAFSFPLTEFLANYISPNHVPGCAVKFVVGFLHVLRIMMLGDPTYSYIEDHQHRNLDTVMIGALEQYSNNEELALVLTLFCHLGSHRLVPRCNIQSTFGVLSNVLPDFPFGHILLGDSTFFDNMFSYEPSNDSLSLSGLWDPTVEIWQEAPGVQERKMFTYYDYCPISINSAVTRNGAPKMAEI